MNGKSILSVAAAVAVLAIVSGVAISAQDKYTLKLPDGIPFSDWKGYEDWQLISTSKTDDRMKVILGNPTIIAAFKSGIPGNGKPFPEGSKIAKVQWKPKKSTDAPFVVDEPEPASATYTADKAGTPSCGQVCHVKVKAKDYVFHPYQKR